MTLLKILAMGLVALTFTLLAMPGFAANGNDGVTTPSDATAKQRQHRKHRKHHGPRRQQHRDRNPDQAPAPARGPG